MDTATPTPAPPAPPALSKGQIFIRRLSSTVLLWTVVLTAIFSVGTVALSLWLLPRLKGAMVAIQWAKRMHGFGALPASADPA